MNRNPSAGASPGAWSCRIDSADVEAMLDAYDSGMCDISTANCISQVISRMFCCGQRCPLIRHDEAHAEIDILGHRVPLPPDLLKWLASAETGGQAEPIEFFIQPPKSVASEPVSPVPSPEPKVATRSRRQSRRSRAPRAVA
ncbi:MAG: hypothetical protein KDM64_05530 [Verrucomicrobiae bacterium]|nr:hypothetical protein [Verrucomicrobiae bacterium]